jgi:hypothetical protein
MNPNPSEYELHLLPLHRNYYSPTRWYMSLEKHGGMLLTRNISWFVHQSSLVILAVEPYNSKAGGTGEWNNKINLRNISFIFWMVFNMPKNFTTWGRRLCFPSEGRRAADFFYFFFLFLKSIALGPRILWLIERTLSTRPSRTTMMTLEGRTVICRFL